MVDLSAISKDTIKRKTIVTKVYCTNIQTEEVVQLSITKLGVQPTLVVRNRKSFRPIFFDFLVHGKIPNYSKTFQDFPSPPNKSSKLGFAFFLYPIVLIENFLSLNILFHLPEKFNCSNRNFER